jgi:hypothetical protein
MLVAVQMGYYAAAAQVIPVLMLVLLVGESRFFKAKGDERGFGVAFPLFAMFVLLLGELTALRALGRGHDSPFLWTFTSIGLIYGLLFVFQSALRSFLEEDLAKAKVPKKRREGLRRLHLLSALGAAVITMIILVPPNCTLRLDPLVSRVKRRIPIRIRQALPLDVAG